MASPYLERSLRSHREASTDFMLSRLADRLSAAEVAEVRLFLAPERGT